MQRTQRDLTVGKNECRIARLGERLVARNVVADVVVAVQMRPTGVAALLRFSPPDASSPSRGALKQVSDFVDSAVALLFESIRTMNVANSDICVMAVGGADIPGETHGAGKQIALAVQRSLWRQGVVLQGDDFGGKNARAIFLDSASGRVIVRSSSLHPDNHSGPAMRVAPAQLAC